MNLVLLGILGYVLVQVALGLWVSRRVATEDDYLVAGRRLGPLLASVSIFATWFGAETCVGAAGRVYEEGLGRHTIEPFGYALCLFVMGLVYAAPFWRRRVVTLADLFRQRFSPAVERFAAILLIPTSLLWAAAQIRAFGHVLSTSTDALGVEGGMLAAAAIVILYTGFGGLLADVVTDLVQGAALVVGLAVLALAVILDLGGLGGALEAAGRALEQGSHAASDPGGWLATIEAWAIPICGSVLAQEALSRSVASRTARIARNAALAGGALYLLVGLVPVFLGLVGPAVAPGLEDGEQLLPSLALERLGPALYVVFAGALVSAILSTVDSTLLAASSLLSRNLLPHEGASDRRRLFTARAGVMLFGLVAWWLAQRSEGVFELVESASGFGSAGVLVAVSFGLFSSFGGAASALSALGAGILVWLYGTEVRELETPYLLSLAAALGAYLSTAVIERWLRRVSKGRASG